MSVRCLCMGCCACVGELCLLCACILRKACACCAAAAAAKTLGDAASCARLCGLGLTFEPGSAIVKGACTW